MNPEGCSRKIKKVKNLNYVSAGSLAPLVKQKVSNRKTKHNSEIIPADQVIKSIKKHHKPKQNSIYLTNASHLEQGQHVSLDSTFPTTQIAHQQVQQMLSNSTTPASQASHEQAAHQQVQQESQRPTTPASQAVQQQMQRDPQDSSNLEANIQDEEQGKNN
ncbi:hypothetical protein HAX54_020018 [Datura stramonium]|uniref:Uncharacterized protein n=1 Tax=Datura stramonium TaxID=4076 RepID=A0ABS8UQ57_DATST|nr:hypothetical protein [Datura stramonium]